MEHFVNHKQLFEVVKNYIQDSNVTKPLLVLGHRGCGKTDVIKQCLEKYGANLTTQELSLCDSLNIDSNSDVLYVETHLFANKPQEMVEYCEQLIRDFIYEYKHNFCGDKYDLPHHLIIEITSTYEGAYGSFVKSYQEDIDWYYLRDNFEDYLAWRMAAGVVKPMDINVFSSQFSRRNEDEKARIKQSWLELENITAYLESGNVDKAIRCVMDSNVNVIMSTLDDNIIKEYGRKLIDILRPYQHLSDRVPAVIKQIEYNIRD